MNPIEPTAQTLPDTLFWRQVRWPMVVVLLLAGHITLMMVGLVCALTIPNAINNVPAYQEYEATSVDAAATSSAQRPRSMSSESRAKK
jgi:hypothetical protein